MTRFAAENPDPIDSVMTVAMLVGGLFVLSRFVDVGDLASRLGTNLVDAILSPTGLRVNAKCPVQSLDPSKNNCLADVLRLNPNFLLQLAEWQAARKANGEDPNDYYDFCAHITRLGANLGGGLFEHRYCGQNMLNKSQEEAFIWSIGMHA